MYLLRAHPLHLHVAEFLHADAPPDFGSVHLMMYLRDQQQGSLKESTHSGGILMYLLLHRPLHRHPIASIHSAPQGTAALPLPRRSVQPAVCHSRVNSRDHLRNQQQGSTRDQQQGSIYINGIPVGRFCPRHGR